MKDNDASDGEDHKVGYGKPPIATRWPAGRSGNPRGRPKGARNFQTELSEELRAKITIQENGKRRKITKRQAVAKQLVNKAASGDLKAIPALLQQSRDIATEREQLAQILDTPDDKAVLAGLFARIRHQTSDPEDQTP